MIAGRRSGLGGGGGFVAYLLGTRPALRKQKSNFTKEDSELGKRRSGPASAVPILLSNAIRAGGSCRG